MDHAPFPEALLTGVVNIDEQHRFLFSLVADMAREPDGPGWERLMLLRLATIGSYAVVHFREEEGLMEACAYPELDAHRQEHQTLVRWLEEFQAEHQAGRAAFPDLVRRMQAWLAEHIQTCDARLAAFLQQSGA
jgi:hemerythrin